MTQRTCSMIIACLLIFENLSSSALELMETRYLFICCKILLKKAPSKKLLEITIIDKRVNLKKHITKDLHEC